MGVRIVQRHRRMGVLVARRPLCQAAEAGGEVEQKNIDVFHRSSFLAFFPILPYNLIRGQRNWKEGWYDTAGKTGGRRQRLQPGYGS